MVRNDAGVAARKWREGNQKRRATEGVEKAREVFTNKRKRDRMQS